MLGPLNERSINSNPLNQTEISDLDFEFQPSFFSFDLTDKIPKTTVSSNEIVMCDNISISPLQKKLISQVSFKKLLLNLQKKRILIFIYFIMLFIGCLTVFTFLCQLYSKTSNYDINNRYGSNEEIITGINKKICSLADMLYLDNKCQKEQDFCVTFSNSMMSLTERFELLRDVFHWVPTVGGIIKNIYSLEAIDNCSYFIGFSYYSIYMWQLNTNNARNLSISQAITLIKIAPNEKFAILSGIEGKAFLFNITSFKVTILESFALNNNIYTKILISNDSKFIFLYCESNRKIYVEHSDKDLIIQIYEGVNQRVYNMISSEFNNDLIINDEVSVKIYFIHSNIPAYIIKNIQEFKKFKGKYHELIHFEKHFAKGNYLKVS
ncbi:hypothetical protein SteCoe_30624 [Stentor coeruleus]|uniref:Uncharacterized protein n=1 Tax=Stentor coeruleus TaxID=5963 RepID=A0A1R2B3B5_9CILI|nr:hypothetical protein SteCoe_30624 [Stentor coeruleus]